MSAEMNYRICSDCGRECDIDLAGDDDTGGRFIYSCPIHGLQAIVDPFPQFREFDRRAREAMRGSNEDD